MKRSIIFSFLTVVLILFTACNEPEGDDYTLVLFGNGRDHWSEATDTEMYETEGTDVVLPGAGTYTRLGFTFTGWNTESDGSGTSYIQGDPFTMPAEACTLYAQWEFAPAAILYKDMVTVTGGSFTQTRWNNYQTSSISHTLQTFMIAKYEVTYELWYVVKHWAEENGYSFENNGEEFGQSAGFFPSNKYRPVRMISWRDAIVWCNAYSDLMDFAPVYEDEEENVLRDSRTENAAAFDNMVWNLTTNGYRLPSEGEWRFAASDRGTTAYDHASGCSADYNDETATQLVAWYKTNAYDVGASDPEYGIHDVGTKDPNGLDIYDMSGNINEYVWDWSGDLPTVAQNNYYGPETGTRKLMLGGNYATYATGIMIGAYASSEPGTESGGLRLARYDN